ncbi:MAG TPA: hypothetical protein PLT93_01345, partial [Phycisphaerae bacterium]|nr:hypothetical protein [Phycisphaerae bacterium]
MMEHACLRRGMGSRRWTVILLLTGACTVLVCHSGARAQTPSPAEGLPTPAPAAPASPLDG